MKTAAKVFKQIVQPAVAVRLVYRNHPALAGLPGGFQHRSDFHRMMAVIINNRHTADFANFCKAAVHAFKSIQSGAPL